MVRPGIPASWMPPLVGAVIWGHRASVVREQMLLVGIFPTGRIPLGGLQNEADAALRFAYG